MESHYDREAARSYCEEHAEFSEDLALRAYTARLLGSQSALTRAGGACCAVKTTVTDLVGDNVEVVFVPGRGSEQRSGGLTPASFVACRMSAVRAVRALADVDLQRADAVVRSQKIDPDAADPEIESQLLALLPGKFADFVQADAILQIACQPDADRRARALLGGDTLFVPYEDSVFKVATHMDAAWEQWVQVNQREPKAVLLDKRGALTWGDTAEDSYARVVELVSQAQEIVASKLEPASSTGRMGGDQDEARRTIAMAVRGAVARASGHKWLARWCDDPAALRFTRRPDLNTIVDSGCAAPRHVLVTKPWPVVIAELGGATPNALRALLDTAIRDYAGRYEHYVSRWQKELGMPVAVRDPWPRVIAVANIGVLCLGRSTDEANRVADVYEQTIAVMEGAEALGRYQPLADRALFAAEFCNGAVRPAIERRGQLDGQVALVTGAASGIGLATSRAMLAAGAHVAITDRDPRVVEALSEWPAQRYAGRFVSLVCDVASEDQCRAAVRATCDAFGGIDILVSNAGVAPSGRLHTDSGDAALHKSLNINLWGHQRMAREAAQAMLAQGSGGVLLYNASKSAFNQGPDFGPYAVPKAALLSLMRQYAVDLGSEGIRSNAVNADRIRTHLHGSLTKGAASDRDPTPSEYFRTNLLGRETTTEAVAEAFVYLATAEATTGCVITVDGGNPAAFPR